MNVHLQCPHCKRLGVWLLALVLAAGGLWGFYLIALGSSDGNLVVKIDSKDVEARFKHGVLQLRGPDGDVKYTLRSDQRSTKLPAGRYRIKVISAQWLTVDVDEFTLAKGGEVTVSVVQRPPLDLRALADKNAALPAEEFKGRVIYAPTPQSVVEKMLDMAKVSRDDIVFDLGCGDGRVVCTAAKKFGAKGIGVDIDPERIKECKRTLEEFGLTSDQVEFRLGDALQVKDLDRATVIMLYMLPEFMAKLELQLGRLKPGTRIVAHDYWFPNQMPDEEIRVQSACRVHELYLWTIK